MLDTHFSGEKKHTLPLSPCKKCLRYPELLSASPFWYEASLGTLWAGHGSKGPVPVNIPTKISALKWVVHPPHGYLGGSDLRPTSTIGSRRRSLEAEAVERQGAASARARPRRHSEMCPASGAPLAALKWARKRQAPEMSGRLEARDERTRGSAGFSLWIHFPRSQCVF